MNLSFFGDLMYHTIHAIYEFILSRYKDNFFVLKLFVKCLFVNTITALDWGRWHTIRFGYKKLKSKIPINTLISYILYYFFNTYLNLDIILCVWFGLFLDMMFFVLKTWNFHIKKIFEKNYMESN